MKEISVREARKIHFRDNGLPLDGGYEDTWTPLKAGPLTVYLFNSQSRKASVQLHDIHHIVTGFHSDLCGEAEISAWELAAGIHDKYFAGAIGLLAVFYGSILYPRRTFAAYLIGKNSKTLYNRNISEALLNQSLSDLQRELLPAKAPKASGRYYAGFCGLFLISSLPFVGVLFVAMMLWQRFF